MVEELTGEQLREALKQAVKLLSLELDCEMCEHKGKCDSGKLCEEYTLKSLVKNPTQLQQHLVYSDSWG